MTKRIKIAVIGAGIGGLTAAYRLHQKGHDVHLFEAKKRVGGRIFTVQVNGHCAELGAHNIADGGAAPNIRNLVQEFNLELEESHFDLIFYYLNEGKFFKDQDLLEEFKFSPEMLQSRLEQIASKSKNMKEVLLALFPADSAVIKMLSVKLAGYEGAEPEHLSTYYIYTLYYMLLGGMSASLPNPNEEKRPNVAFLKKGNSLLPQKLAESLASRVHLNMPLASVQKNAEGSYLLTFKNGQVINADRLVLAMPCGAYQDINFSKEVIPEERLKKICNVQCGKNAKICTTFPSFQEKKGFLNDNAGAFLLGGQKVLTLYLMRKGSQFSKETVQQIYQQQFDLVEKGFGVKLPLETPQLAADEQFTYSGPVGHSWPNDPYIKGSYSNIAPGQEYLLEMHEESGETVKTLFAPIDQTLYFAGEHASIQLEGAGTMEAACESGERAVRMMEQP